MADRQEAACLPCAYVGGGSLRVVMLLGFRGGGLLLLLFLVSARLASAQTASESTSLDSTQVPPVVTDVEFEGNELFSDADLALRIRTKSNRRFLDVPGLTWWLWLYRLGESGALGRRLGQALMASGEAPAFLDSTIVSADVERLRLFYLQEGFRDVQVHAGIDTLGNGRRARVTFHIQPGEPTYIRQVRYEGIDELAGIQRDLLIRNSLLRPERTATGQALSFRTRSQRYSEPVLLEERRRLLTFLRDEGYAAVTRDSIRALVFPQGADSFDVVFRINPGSRYRFGDVHFDVTGPEETPVYYDTLAAFPAAPEQPGGVVTARIEDEGKLEPELLERSLQFRPGDWYDQSALLATKRRLEATGVFAFSDIVPLPTDTVPAYSAWLLPHRLDLRTRRRHQIRLETFVLQRSGITAGTENELGTGLGVAYENANLFGGGETFQVRLTGSVAANVDAPAGDTLGLGSSLFNSAQAEVSTSLVYPYLIGPFGRLDRLFNLYDARTRFSLSLLTARRDRLRIIIRGRGQARARLELQHSPTDASLLDLIDLTLSNPDTLAGFDTLFFKPVLAVIGDDPVQEQQIIEDYTRPQVNSALRYTFRSLTANPLRRDQGYSLEAAFELGSNLPYLLDRFVWTPDTLEGSLPGLPIFSGNRPDSRLIYRQYVRAVADMRRYHPVARGRVLAWKLSGGVARPYGRADVVPFDRRFYTGGATGVRGWDLRSLGPGATNTYQGGEIMLEGSAELRTRVIRSLFAADWSLALFADAGNVWLFPRRVDSSDNPGSPGDENGGRNTRGFFYLDSFYKQFGVGSGLGLRIGWEYLILRLDLAYKVYDPSQADKGFIPDGFGSPSLHFGIGHAF